MDNYEQNMEKSIIWKNHKYVWKNHRKLGQNGHI